MWSFSRFDHMDMTKHHLIIELRGFVNKHTNGFFIFLRKYGYIRYIKVFNVTKYENKI